MVANLCYQLVDDTKLPCYTLPLMQHFSFFRNLPPLNYRYCLIWLMQTWLMWHNLQHLPMHNWIVTLIVTNWFFNIFSNYRQNRWHGHQSEAVFHELPKSKARMERTTVQTNQRCKLQSLIMNYLHLENFNFFVLRIVFQCMQSIELETRHGKCVNWLLRETRAIFQS